MPRSGPGVEIRGRGSGFASSWNCGVVVCMPDQPLDIGLPPVMIFRGGGSPAFCKRLSALDVRMALAAVRRNDPL